VGHFKNGGKGKGYFLAEKIKIEIWDRLYSSAFSNGEF